MTRCLRPAILALVVFFTVTVRPAAAVTIRDIVELTRAGLSDDIIIALLEADPTIFSLDAAKLLELRSEGVSERVLIEMLRSGRSPQAATQAAPEPPPPIQPAVTDPPPPAPPVVVIEHYEAPRPEAAYVAYPYFVPVFTPGFTRPHRPLKRGFVTESRSFGRFMNDGFVQGPAGSSPGRFINDGTTTTTTTTRGRRR
jgi:hypothetical protein